MATLAQAAFRWDNRVELRFPYNAWLVDALKREVPHPHREWHPETKTWIVDALYATQALNLLRQVYLEAMISERQDVPPSRPDPLFQTDPHYATLHLLPSAPPCVIEAAYRALVKEHHPDRAPVHKREQAHEAMVALNAAYERVRDRMAS